MTTIPETDGAYRIVRVDPQSRSLFGVDASGREWVLKPLPPECLTAGGLHPEVRDRLARVREAAHPQLAILREVICRDSGVWAVWEWVPGKPMSELTGDESDAGQLAASARRGVEALHRLGLVHGAAHDRNLIRTPSGGVMITHVSPQLYDDPAADMYDLDALDRRLAAAGGSPNASGLGDPAGRDGFRPGLGAFAASPGTIRPRSQTQWRWKSLALAGVVLVGGLLWIAAVFQSSGQAKRQPPEWSDPDRPPGRALEEDR